MNPVKTLFALGLVAGACVDQPETTTADQDIHTTGSSLASQFQRDRAGAINRCNATRISPTFALTALHCKSSGDGGTMNFYMGGPGMAPALTANIAETKKYFGMDAKQCHDNLLCDNNVGTFSDIAVLRLDQITPSVDGTVGTIATMAWRYPGDNVTGTAVGAGDHGETELGTNVENPDRNLRQINDTTVDSDDADGDFYTSNDVVDPADSGGPFYVNNKVVGILHGHGWDATHWDFTKYTSVAKHLNWILTNIGYQWPGAPPQQDTTYAGSLIESFTGTEQVCQYACEHTQACQAYNYHSLSCGLYTNVTAANTQAGWRGALHYGASTGQSNEVVGYRRNDGWNAVLHKATDNTIHELVLGTTYQWFVGTILPMANKAIAGKLSVFRRSDGKNAIVYRATDGSVIEVRLDGGWTPKWININVASASGDPTAFTRADGVSAIVYRAGTRIIELRLLSDGNYAATDLTTATNTSAFPASSDPSPTVRADGLTSVVYRSGTQIVELFRRPGEPWSAGVPSSLATWFTNGFPVTIPAATGRPYASTRRDGTLAILYRSDFNRLVELRLQSTGWKWQDITGSQSVGGNPVQYVRTDTIESAVYRSTTNEVNEMARFPGEPAATLHGYNLSASYGVGAVTTDPQVYLRNDRVNSTVYGLPYNRVGELQYERGAGWATNNLTFASGETP